MNNPAAAMNATADGKHWCALAPKSAKSIEFCEFVLPPILAVELSR